MRRLTVAPLALLLLALLLSSALAPGIAIAADSAVAAPPALSEPKGPALSEPKGPALSEQSELKAPAPADVKAVASALAPLRDAQADDPALWAAARQLKALGKNALPALRDAARGKQPPAAQLALGWSLLSLEDRGPGIKLLASLIAGPADPATRSAAARILAQPAGTAAEVELTRLVDSVDNDRVRVAVAQALTSAATSEAAETKATTALVRLARAADPETRAAAALALAELDDFRDPVPATLKALAEEPTPRGRLAQSLLDRNRLSDLMVREREYAGSLGSKLLDEIKHKFQTFHFDPSPSDEAFANAAARGIASVAAKTDPFSSYLSSDDWKEFREELSGTYGGVGAQVLFLKDDRTGEPAFTAIKPIYSGPAFRAGLRSYDQILEVDGQPVKGKTAETIRDQLRGLPQSTVACKIRRRGLDADQLLDLKIVREIVSLPTVSTCLLPGNIGYLHLDGFGDTSAAEVEKGLQSLEQAGMKALILDLRSNPGGLLTAARDIADKFLKGDKLIVYSEGRNKQVAPRSELRTTNGPHHPDYPIIILVNGGTASAAEVVSGALQDHKRATLIGERTYGKGSVQQLLPLDAAGRKAILKLTIAHYYLPSGRCIHRTPDNRGGILPDIEVPYQPIIASDSFQKHLEAGDFYRYSLLQWPQNKPKLTQLAEFDSHDTAQYPGFDAWYQTLNIRTDRDTARRLLRQWIRALAADELVRDWTCDIEEDNQLQRAVLEAAAKIPGLDPASIPEYKVFVKR